MATYKRPDQMSVEQKKWLALSRQAMKGAGDQGRERTEYSDKGIVAAVETALGDRINVRLREKQGDRLMCIARFRSDGHLETFLDRTKEPWEEFLFPQPG